MPENKSAWRWACCTRPSPWRKPARRDQARDALAQGDDPAQLKREAKLTKAASDASTFKKLALQWWNHWKGPKTARHSEYVLRRLEADVFPALPKT